MTKEKLVKSSKYLQDLTNRLEAPIPAKHIGHPESYRRFLKNEISTIKAQLEAAKLEATGK